MTKNLVICCDGTGNQFEVDQTNVLKLHSALVIDSEHGQVAYYAPGVGTFSPKMALTRPGAAFSKLLGLSLGYGYRQTIANAYRFLMNHYEPGDRIFLFGFSRGAYAIRIIAAMIHGVGILCRGNHQLIPYALAELELRKGRQLDFQRLGRFRKQFSRRLPEKPDVFLGAWDTVSSISWAYDYLAYAFTASNPSLRVVRHAVAIDESRAFFAQNLFRHGPKIRDTGERALEQDIKEVWFAGCHSDVGGGYPESESGLSKLALEWMLVEARDVGGLILDETRVASLLSGGEAIGPEGTRHHSLRGAWHLAEWFPKQTYGVRFPRPHLYRKRQILRRNRDESVPAKDALPIIHQSAVERRSHSGQSGWPEYSPPNWPESHEIEPWKRF